MISFIVLESCVDGIVKSRPLSFETLEDGNWLDLDTAARVLGIDRKRIARLLGEFLVPWRPSPRQRLVSKASVEQLVAAIKSSPSFWSDPAAQAVVRASVELEISKRVAASLQTSEPMPPSNGCIIDEGQEFSIPRRESASKNSVPTSIHVSPIKTAKPSS